jgi:hypothetical protein
MLTQHRKLRFNNTTVAWVQSATSICFILHQITTKWSNKKHVRGKNEPEVIHVQKKLQFLGFNHRIQ